MRHATLPPNARHRWLWLISPLSLSLSTPMLDASCAWALMCYEAIPGWGWSELTTFLYLWFEHIHSHVSKKTKIMGNGGASASDYCGRKRV